MMTSRNRHPKKDVQKAIDYALERGWRLELRGGHTWGILYCPHGHQQCRSRISSTPQNSGNQAKRIKQDVNRCPG
ncbi:MAG TPA: hypothetical protein VFG50_12625 [Rhodothermales bacterium]|nr:hypothetical protein [Rhodothermales bacterium]